jgi:hypothetical protein
MKLTVYSRLELDCFYDDHAVLWKHMRMKPIPEVLVGREQALGLEGAWRSRWERNMKPSLGNRSDYNIVA